MQCTAGGVVWSSIDLGFVFQEVDEAAPLKRIRCDSVSSPTSPKWEPADVGGAWRFCIGLCKQLDNIQRRYQL